ncbi:MAG TPA: molybdopterin dinucleotide binding domain-containing protein, partial [Methylomirabilota bacterium]|nr:molybdopterin dinucleotide binding domain-containing protein [Methylomirabilota bacterium]
TRTSAMADIYAPIRAGSDIAFLGGVINHVLNHPRWNSEPFFRTWLLHYTNAATLISETFKDTEDLDGVFSGLVQYKGGTPEWPYNGFVGEYDNKSWQYARGGGRSGAQGEAAANSGRAGENSAGASGQRGADGAPSAPKSGKPGNEVQAPPGPPFDPLVRALLKPPPERDETLQHPHCAFQILKRHFARYTPEMVERVTGCPRDTFLRVAEAILKNSGPDRTTSFAYAVAWTQHTNGPQVIGTCALLQLLLGNVGRPGAGIMALRGHASIQGSTDIPTLYHSIHGYLPAPSALKKHATLQEYLGSETLPTGYYGNTPKFMVSYLKSMWGPAATKDNQFGYDWHPKILGDHSHLPMFVAMNDGKVKGMLLIGQNPATSLNARLERAGLRKLEWLVVKDNWVHESAMFWKSAPEVKSGEVKIADIKTEVFFFPSSQVAEVEGSFTNTQRMLQWHYKAAEAPGDCRSDLWFTYQLGRRLKKRYEASAAPRDEGFRRLLFDYEHDDPRERQRGEPQALKILKEINGFSTDDPGKHLASFGDLKDDGSTTCASWIYCGVFPAPDQNRAASKQPDPPGQPGAQLNWGYAWPANRRLMYNRASADPQGRPWSERKKWVWWDEAQKKWVGYDVPDFTVTKAPGAKGDPKGVAMDALSGTEPFIMKPDGRGWLFVPNGLVDGPLPTHYEPAESPVKNPLYKQQSSPVLKYWKRDDNALAAAGDGRFPHVMTTYRLTEHYLAGAMSRWNPWLAELQPELFVELSPELAAEKGIQNLDWVRISTPRSHVRAKALVTRRLRPFTIDGKVVHQVGMPWHWGYEGIVTGDVVNELTSLVGDPNVTIHEGKAFVCNVEKA